MRNQPATGRRVLAVAACALALGGVSVALDAATAHGATIGGQQTLRPPAVFPVDFPGRRYAKGARITRGHAVLSRRVAIGVKEGRKRLRFTCPRGTVAFTPGLPGVSEIGVAIDDLSQYKHPRRTFRLRVFSAPARFVDGDTAHGTVYLLCGPRSQAPALQ
jgi:hypothetical protein